MKIEALNIFSSAQTKQQVAVERERKEQTKRLKIHQAAIDGYIDMLCDASKRDANLPSDRDGYTPTLVAAQNGNLDALRILVGRGGEPERTIADGSCALHLAAMRNHLNCVSFLVNFGVNMWALDNELRTAKDVAALAQKKEVLDYLDQMMAKQSALNTKTVQKLKEKAKLSAEKRLKQLRKAQLKAIKRDEKDERYLIRLSNNRRILKAAHSISDIKLVGRVGGMIDYRNGCLASTALDNSNSTKIREDSLGSRVPLTPLASISAGRLSSSPSVSNLMMSSNKIDLLSHTRRPGQLNLRANVSAYTSTTDDSSAYSSASVSSSSGYLSSGAGSGVSAMPIISNRPKYSDLVAVNGCLGSSSVFKQQQQKSAKHLAKQQASNSADQQSLKGSGSSIIGTKLWGLSGGVSRKVQLKRMLLGSNVTSSSTADLTGIGGQQKSTTLAGALSSSQLFNPTNHLHRDPSINDHNHPAALSPKLCNVQPAIKLKLNTSPTSNNSNTDQQQSIKWPPAPTMTRALSEPDFSAALQSDENFKGETGDDDDDDDDDCTDTYLHEPSECEVAPSKKEDEKRQFVTEQQNPKQPDRSENVDDKQQVTVESQHHLLTQCLSQLKLRHEAISRQQNTESDQIIKPSRLVSAASSQSDNSESKQIRVRLDSNRQNPTYRNSDELLQLRQLNSGKFPLRPSAIKLQQQQQQQQLLQQQAQTNQNKLNSESCNDGSKYVTKFAAGKLTTISIDSIGSAGSFVHRNYIESSSSSEYPQIVNPHSSSSTSSSPPASTSSSSSSSSTSTSTSSYPSPREQSSSKSGSTKIYEPRKPDDNNYELETIEQFLLTNGLSDLNEVFAEEKIDLEALMLLTEEDLKSLNILLGPRRKLLHAIQDKRQRQLLKLQDKMTLTSHPTSCANGAMFMMVDTPL